MTPAPLRVRAALAGLAVLALSLIGGAVANTPHQQMRDLLLRGFYNSAARVSGPALVEAFPDDPEAHYLYGYALYLTGSLDAARREVDAALLRSPAPPPPELERLDGLLLAAAGDPVTALPVLESAFRRSSRYEFAMDWARVAWQAGAFEVALGAYEAAADTEQGRREPWPALNRGRILSFLGRVEEAAEAFQAAITVFEAHDTGDTRPSPAYVEAYYRLGQSYERLAALTGSEEEYLLAAENYRAALTADPNYGPAIAALDALSRRSP